MLLFCWYILLLSWLILLFFCCSLPSVGYHHGVITADIYSLTICGYTLWSWYQLISTALPSMGTPCGADINWYLQPYLLWVHPVELLSTDIYSLTFCGYTLWSWYLQPYLLWVPPVELISADIYSLTFCEYPLWSDISWYLQPYLLWVHPVELISIVLRLLQLCAIARTPPSVTCRHPHTSMFL